MTKEDWETALRLLREAQEEIQRLAWDAEGDQYYGNDLADSIGKFVAQHVEQPE